VINSACVRASAGGREEEGDDGRWWGSVGAELVVFGGTRREGTRFGWDFFRKSFGMKLIRRTYAFLLGHIIPREYPLCPLLLGH
jgi:hypothetical protein